MASALAIIRAVINGTVQVLLALLLNQILCFLLQKCRSSCVLLYLQKHVGYRNSKRHGFPSRLLLIGLRKGAKETPKEP